MGSGLDPCQILSGFQADVVLKVQAGLCRGVRSDTSLQGDDILRSVVEDVSFLHSWMEVRSRDCLLLALFGSGGRSRRLLSFHIYNYFYSFLIAAL